ncbi:MAG: hypothetical protein NTY46_11305 [Candidatus Sumerlaeota bacterium]|nr:hypothetical protein [Candidatus Sumerlaeota bacterium]
MTMRCHNHFPIRLNRTAAAIAAMILLILTGGCALLQRTPYENENGTSNPWTNAPQASLQSVMNKGFAPAQPEQLKQQGRVWWCARVLNMPGGRIFGALGWYHEWIYTPDREAGADFAGCDSIKGTWPASWTAFFSPMTVTEHTGAAAQPGTFAKPVPDVDYAKIQQRLQPGSRAGTIFPITNCNSWVRKTVRAAGQQD